MKALLVAALTFVLSTVVAVAQDSYRIQPGDTLSVEVLEDSGLNRQLLVTPSGTVSFPFAGAIRAENRTTDQVAAILAQGIASNFAVPPNVFVSVVGLGGGQDDAAGDGRATITVYFLGEVGTPGARQVLSGTSILQALAQSGGLTNFAAERRIQLRRTDPRTMAETVATIDYRALQNGGRLSTNVVLADGDVILVPQRRLFE